MKLFTKYNRINLLATVVIFLLASTAFYFLLRYVIIDQLDENLKIEQDEIENYTVKYHRLPEVIPVKDQQIMYIPAKQPQARRIFKTVTAYDRVEKETGAFRRLYFTIPVNGAWYQVIVGKSLEGTESLIQSIIIITTGTIFLMLMASLVINRMVLRRLWQPFYHSLEMLRSFQVKSRDSFQLPASNVEEFNFMNTILQQATHQAGEDYRVLKEFTENASHEMQTPLAIMRSKLDLLIQDEHLSRRQGDVLQGVYEAIHKLSRLSASLLLLAKIENRQYKETASVDLKEKVEAALVQFREIWQNKHLKVTAELQDLHITMNTALADILLNNLLTNATRHNFSGGTIHIAINRRRQLVIQNSGAAKPLDESRLFTRFYKSMQPSGQTGLGLSIIRQICTVSGCTVAYNFESGMHIFTVTW